MILLGIPGLEDAVEINSGGFGVIYRARQPAFDRTVAVKVLREPLSDPMARKRFERECQALGALSGHPHIITVHDGGVNANGRPYLVMEYMAAGSLADRLRRTGRMPWQEVMDMAVKVASGLHTAHRAGVLHRDLKPENILVSSFGEPKLADFGIARIKRATETVLTEAITVAHAAPELFLHGIKHVPPSVQSDLYGLGSTLFELLAGRLAFVRDTDETFGPVLYRINFEPVPDLRPEGVPAQVCAIVERLMAKKPEDRFASAERLGRAIQQLQRDTGLLVTRLTVDRSVSQETAGNFTLTGLAAPAQPIGRSNPRRREERTADAVPGAPLTAPGPAKSQATNVVQPELPAEPSPLTPPPPTSPRPRSRRGSRRAAVAITAILVLALVGVGTVIALRGMATRPVVSPSEVPVTPVDPSEVPFPGIEPSVAISVALGEPQRVAVDTQGNVYIADTVNHRVRRVDPRSGMITLVAGTGTAGFSGDRDPAPSAELNSPAGVAVDDAGNLYIADTGNHRVRMVDLSGVITTVAGSGEQGFSGDGDPATSAELRFPRGVAVDDAGNLYIADFGNRRVRRVRSGVITTVAGSGEQGFSGDGGPATTAELNGPADVAVDDAGNLYIADTGNHRVRRVRSGVIMTVAGGGTDRLSGDGGPATSAELNSPASAVVDEAGNLYIADTLNNRVRAVDRTGTITTLAGTGRRPRAE